MASAPAGVSRISLFKTRSSDFNGRNWIGNGCCLAPPQADHSLLVVLRSAGLRKLITCSAVQGSSTPTAAAGTKEAAKPEAKAAAAAETKEAAKPEAKEAPAKPKPAAKAPAKPLPQAIEEEVIPALRSILEAQKDITDIELAFNDNRLEGSFLQNGVAYCFWAFFPDGTLTGPKGFALSSYGSEVSTIEPFLVDEKKPTTKQVIFWVEKRLAAQGILPVWTD